MASSTQSSALQLETLPDPGDRYTLGPCLGSGVFANVFEANDNQEAGKRVAVKIQTVAQDNMQDLAEEYMVLRDLSSHPNLPDFYGVYIKKEATRGAGDQLWFVMELCGGGTAIDLVRGLQEKNKRMHEEHIAYLMKGTLKAMIHLHEGHVMHRDIKGKKEQIQDMELELENLQKTNTSLELQLAELREKLGATDNELRQEKSHNREANALLRRIRLDLHEASGLVQEPKKLRDAVRSLYHKYNQDQEFMTTCAQDVDAQVEFKRQREHLERTVAALKRQNLKDTSNKQSDDLYRIIQENTTLIVEINELRKELKMAQRHIRDMESILGIGGKNLGTKEAQMKLGLAIASTQQVHREYRDRMQEYETLVSVLRDEVQRLVGKLSKKDQDEYYMGEREKRLNIFKRSDGGQK